VALKSGIDQPKGGEFRHREVARPCQRAVEHGRNVSVAQKEQIFSLAVHAEGGWIVPHYVEVEGSKELGTAHGAARVSRLRLVNHAQYVAPNL
jgi:hypothetical protein